MGNKLGISALIFGLIGAGLGGYVFVANTFFPVRSSIQNTWFIYDMPGTELGDGVFDYLEPTSLVISVNPNENVYILFTCYITFDTTATEAVINIYIDTISVIWYWIMRTSTGQERVPVSVQYGGAISSGTHNVSVWGYSDIANQWCYRCALLVQTYK
ncbi:MAG: hypothetical protein ACFFDF_22170 [Candidatus Odinarchaeota archaeon]